MQSFALVGLVKSVDLNYFAVAKNYFLLLLEKCLSFSLRILGDPSNQILDFCNDPLSLLFSHLHILSICFLFMRDYFNSIFSDPLLIYAVVFFILKCFPCSLFFFIRAYLCLNIFLTLFEIIASVA